MILVHPSSFFKHARLFAVNLPLEKQNALIGQPAAEVIRKRALFRDESSIKTRGSDGVRTVNISSRLSRSPRALSLTHRSPTSPSGPKNLPSTVGAGTSNGLKGAHK